jgi:spore cortex protein
MGHSLAPKANKGVFSLRKGIMAVGVFCLAGGLAACGSYEGALDGRYDDSARPIGYYTNENHRDNNGNAYIMNDNDGPVTEFLDRGAMDRRTNVNRREMVNPTVPYAERDRTFFERDNRFKYNDINYHGHLNSMNAKTRSSYYKRYNGELAEKISMQAKKVDDVSDARTLVYRDSVLVAVNTNARDVQRLENKVKQAVAPYTKNKKVRVVANPSMYQRVRVIDNNMRYGQSVEEIEKDLQTIFNNGEIIERPLNRR